MRDEPEVYDCEQCGEEDVTTLDHYCPWWHYPIEKYDTIREWEQEQERQRGVREW